MTHRMLTYKLATKRLPYGLVAPERMQSPLLYINYTFVVHCDECAIKVIGSFYFPRHQHQQQYLSYSRVYAAGAHTRE